MRKLRTALFIFFIVMTVAFVYIRVTSALTADHTAPQISADSDEIRISIEDGEDVLLSGMSAADNKDGDVTDTLVVVSKSKFIEEGVVNVNYAAFDSHNNVGTYTRKVIYTDYTSPEFAISAPLVFRASEDYPEYLANIGATDVLDGDISSLIRLTDGSKVEDEEGNAVMPLEIQVTNAEGDTSNLSIEVEFLNDRSYSAYAPALSTYLVYTDVNTEINPESYLTGIRQGQNLQSFSATDYTAEDVVIDTSDVRYSKPGVYKIVYTLYQSERTGVVVNDEDEDGYEELGSTTLFIVVRD